MADSLEIEAATAEVKLNGQTYNLRWPGDQSLIDAMLDAGIDAPFACKAGKCASCACQLVSGEAAMDHNEILTEDDIAEGYILGCQARPLSAEIKVEF